MTPLSPAWIASRLTPAQRDALMWLPGDGSERQQEGSTHQTSLWKLTGKEVGQDVIVRLAVMPVARVVDGKFAPYMWSATPLADRLREALAEEYAAEWPEGRHLTACRMTEPGAQS